VESQRQALTPKFAAGQRCEGKGTLMMNARGIAGLGMLALGLGIGATVGSTPGIASADDLDFQISIDGYDLLPTTDNSATAVSGTGDMAIAWGDGSNALSVGGFGDFAAAEGTDTTAKAGGTSASTFDSAVDIGNNTVPGVGVIAANGSGDIAYADGDNSTASAGGVDGNTIFTNDLASNNDIAAVFDPSGTSGSFADAGASFTDPGNSDIAAVFSLDGTGVGIKGIDGAYNIDSPLGESSSAAATGGGFLSELFQSLGEGTSSSGGNLLTDLLSLF
jgi:hypothetical protein